MSKWAWHKCNRAANEAIDNAATGRRRADGSSRADLADRYGHLPIGTDHFRVRFVMICPNGTDRKMALPARDVGVAAHPREGEMPMWPAIRMLSEGAPRRRISGQRVARGCLKREAGGAVVFAPRCSGPPQGPD